MDEHEILQHLLQVESGAAALVNEAHTEAERRLAEAEAQERTRFNERYTQETASLQAAFEQEKSAIQAEYTKELESYQQSLDTLPVDRAGFSALFEQYLFGTTLNA
ncbi:hypothetical protein FACS1894164_04440 [Spirochaetia bacterium]|nr:hypothetical protein FACS1894164_04440 [Spirochaetia bacterium]